jgi:hypothetical protein
MRGSFIKQTNVAVLILVRSVSDSDLYNRITTRPNSHAIFAALICKQIKGAS